MPTSSHMPTSNAPSHGEGGPLMLVPFTGLPPEVIAALLIVCKHTPCESLA